MTLFYGDLGRVSPLPGSLQLGAFPHGDGVAGLGPGQLHLSSTILAVDVVEVLLERLLDLALCCNAESLKHRLPESALGDPSLRRPSNGSLCQSFGSCQRSWLWPTSIEDGMSFLLFVTMEGRRDLVPAPHLVDPVIGKLRVSVIARHAVEVIVNSQVVHDGLLAKVSKLSLRSSLLSAVLSSWSVSTSSPVGGLSKSLSWSKGKKGEAVHRITGVSPVSFNATISRAK